MSQQHHQWAATGSRQLKKSFLSITKTCHFFKMLSLSRLAPLFALTAPTPPWFCPPPRTSPPCALKPATSEYTLARKTSLKYSSLVLFLHLETENSSALPWRWSMDSSAHFKELCDLSSCCQPLTPTTPQWAQVSLCALCPSDWSPGLRGAPSAQSHSSGARKACLLGLQMPSSLWPRMAVLLHCTCIQTSSSYNDSSQIGLGPTLMQSPRKALSPNSHILRYWG